MTPIVYLHGFASSPASKKAQYFKQKLEGCGATVTVPDLAAGDFEHLTLSGQLRVIEAAAEGRRISLIGSSMGGYLAAIYAARHPEVERVVLLAPAFRFAFRWAETIGDRQMAEWQCTGQLPVFHYAEGRTLPVGYALYEDGAQFEEFPDVKQPVLVFHGEHDTVVPAAYSRQFAQERPNVELHVVDSDHELLDVLEPMWDRVRLFLSTPPKAR